MAFVLPHSVVIAGLNLVVFDCVDPFSLVQRSPCWFRDVFEILLHVVRSLQHVRTHCALILQITADFLGL